MKPTFLIGFMGSGKSTIAKLLTADFIDLDAVIVEQLGMSISDFFDQYGEAKFREIEAQTLKKLSNSDGIISTGGGIIISEENRRILRESPINVIYLKSEFDALYDRIMADKDNVRPLFLDNTREELSVIYMNRVALYEEVATATVSVTNKTPEEIVKEIQL